MPHLTIEHSANLADRHDVDALVGAVHEVALGHDWVPASGMRTRAVARDRYRVADGAADRAFVAITVRIGPGRTDEEKQALLDEVLDGAMAHVEGPDGGDTDLTIAWSIEVQEIDARWRVNRNRIRIEGEDA